MAELDQCRDIIDMIDTFKASLDRFMKKHQQWHQNISTSAGPSTKTERIIWLHLRWFKPRLRDMDDHVLIQSKLLAFSESIRKHGIGAAEVCHGLDTWCQMKLEKKSSSTQMVGFIERNVKEVFQNGPRDQESAPRSHSVTLCSPDAHDTMDGTASAQSPSGIDALGATLADSTASSQGYMHPDRLAFLNAHEEKSHAVDSISDDGSWYSCVDDQEFPSFLTGANRPGIFATSSRRKGEDVQEASQRKKLTLDFTIDDDGQPLNVDDQEFPLLLPGAHRSGQSATSLKLERQDVKEKAPDKKPEKKHCKKAELMTSGGAKQALSTSERMTHEPGKQPDLSRQQQSESLESVWGRNSKAYRKPKKGYLCNRCHIEGHHLHECPTNLDPSFDPLPVPNYICAICKTPGDHLVTLCPQNRAPTSLTMQRKWAKYEAQIGAAQKRAAEANLIGAQGLADALEISAGGGLGRPLHTSDIWGHDASPIHGISATHSHNNIDENRRPDRGRDLFEGIPYGSQRQNSVSQSDHDYRSPMERLTLRPSDEPRYLFQNFHKDKEIQSNHHEGPTSCRSPSADPLDERSSQGIEGRLSYWDQALVSQSVSKTDQDLRDGADQGKNKSSALQDIAADNAEVDFLEADIFIAKLRDEIIRKDFAADLHPVDTGCAMEIDGPSPVAEVEVEPEQPSTEFGKAIKSVYRHGPYDPVVLKLFEKIENVWVSKFTRTVALDMWTEGEDGSPP